MAREPVTDPLVLPGWQVARLELLQAVVGDLGLSLGQRAALVVLARQEQATVEHLAAILALARTTAAPAGDTVPAGLGSAAVEQAGLLAVLAGHLAAHPHLAPVYLSPRGDVQVGTDQDPVVAARMLLAWFRSVAVTGLVVRLEDGYASVHAHRAGIGGYQVRVWGTVAGLQRLLVQGGHPARHDSGLSLTVGELAHFAEHGSLPAPVGGEPR